MIDTALASMRNNYASARLRVVGRLAVPAIVALLLTAACSNELPLSYSPTVAISQHDAPVIGKVMAIDLRHEADPRWYGAIRGGFGNPLKVLTAKNPLSLEIAQAFRDALKARRMLAPEDTRACDATLEIVQFEATQMARREANVTLRLNITDKSGQPNYSDTATADRMNGYVLSLDVGIFGSPEELRQITLEAMNQAIDELLDKPALLAVLRRQLPELAEHPGS